MNGGDERSAAGYATSAGALLREAREAAGLSMEAVAQQLKLAPRQVRAIEEDDYARLPGRTFVRGFVRNYARLLNLDADAVVAGLPRGEATSPLERLTFSPTGHTMGELPVETERRRGVARWLIPLALLAIVGAAAYYEYMRPTSETRRAHVETAAPAAPAPAGQATVALPNPLDGARGDALPGRPATGAPAPAQAAAAAPAGAGDASPAAAAPATLVLNWNGPSWVEIKDATGATLLAQTGIAGTTQAVTGVAPLDVTVGNATNVAISFRGQPFDLGPHTRYNVARFSLK